MRDKIEKFSVASKFTAILALSVVLAGLLTGIVLIRKSTEAHYNARVETLSVAAKMLAVHLDEYMNRLIIEMEALAEVFEMVEEADKQELLEQFGSQRPELQALSYLSKDGRRYTSGNWLGEIQANNPQAQQQSYIQPVAVYEGTPVLTVFTPSPVGHFQSQVNLERLSMQQKLLDIKLGESGHPYLLDSEGMVISHRYNRYVGQQFNQLIVTEEGGPVDIDLYTGATFSYLEYTLDDMERLAGIIPLPRLGLLVGFSQSIAEIQKPVILLQRGLGFLTALLTFVVLILGVVLGRMVTGPLGILAAQLKEIQNGSIYSLTGGGESPEITLIRCAVNKLISKLHETSISAVASLALALEAKDSATKGHSQRVAEIATLIGQALDYPASSLKVLSRAALLHDIGKIAIPDSILFKADRLSDEENMLIRLHPQIAKRMLSPLLFLKEEIQVIEQHHEWVNGCGYPGQLKGPQIHPLAKVLAVADAYEAMTANRPYRRALSANEAMSQLLAGKGSQFDGAVIEKFIELMDRRRFYYGERGTKEFAFGREGA